MKAIGAQIADIDSARRSTALLGWVEDCTSRMEARWPTIAFSSNYWPLSSTHKARLLDINFEPAIADFGGKDSSYVLALKCLMAEIALKGDIKDPFGQLPGWRLLADLDVPLAEIRHHHLTKLEEDLVRHAQSSPSSAGTLHRDLLILRTHLDVVAAKGVADRFVWSISPDTRRRLVGLRKSWAARFKSAKASILDRQIEALSDAHNALFRGDERLSAYDKVALAVMGISMCCPSRVNEPLCMSVNDRFTLEDYLTANDAPTSPIADVPLTRVHQMLLVKGSKGAEWGAKPILNFMIDFANLCIEVIVRHGERSRMLVAWYETHPDKLFLPSELESLRGTQISQAKLSQILRLESGQASPGGHAITKRVWEELRADGQIKEIPNPKTHTKTGRENPQKTLQVAEWIDVEAVLLKKVKRSLEDLRRVTRGNHYLGRLSNMLMLFDGERSPYLPESAKYSALLPRLQQSERYKEPRKRKKSTWSPDPTLFEKLNIKMVANGVVEYASIGTHDPRRWLTTQALDAGLPDVLANKWANRLDIDQLKAYDLRTAERRAEQASMPVVNELSDISHGLQKIEALESDYGLETEVVVVGDASISMTSIDEIMRATEERPVARTSNQIIVLYPQRYGMCLHQHHERPCRSYKCAPCNESIVVKGHLPTNERLRKDSAAVFQSIVNQLEALFLARQRQLADNPETLDEHILALVREGLKPDEMAAELITQFHEINDQIKDRPFANKLADAFALTGYVRELDRESNAPGALIKYHNPSCHAAPGHERALDARLGGRIAVKSRIEAFDRNFPQFSPTAQGKIDQRAFLEVGQDSSEEDTNE